MSQVTFSFDDVDQQSNALFVRKDESFTITAENEAITAGNVEIFYFRQSRPREVVKLDTNAPAVITADGSYRVVNTFGFDGHYVARSSGDFEGALDITLEDNVDLVTPPNLYKRPDGSTFMQVYDDHVEFPEVPQSGGVPLASTIDGVEILSAATTDLTAEDSGKVFTVRPGVEAAGSMTINLPALQAGLSFRFQYSTVGSVADGQNVLIQTPPNVDKIDGLLLDGEGTSQSLNGFGKITFVGLANGTAARAGDWLECRCDGERWNVSGASKNAAGFTAGSWE
jgi:hypothetical protein